MSGKVGLCAQCRLARRIRTRRGSEFWMCDRHREDPAYPRYPRLPVVACRGHEAGDPTDSGEER